MAMGATDSDAITRPARTQIPQANATAAILLAERIVVPSLEPSLCGVLVNYNTISKSSGPL
jgi:hypothetical protein